MNPEEIRQQAQKERLRQEAKKRKKKKVKLPKPKGFQPVSPDSWYVFSRIYLGELNVFFWFFVVLTLGVVFLFLYWENKEVWMLQAGLALAGLVALRLLVYYLMKIYAFTGYRFWRKTLPFALYGWDVLGQKEKYPAYTKWDLNVTLSVKTKTPPTVEIAALIRDALFIFITKANKNFYEPNNVQAGFVGEIRKKWNFAGPDVVMGSANATILGEMYVCINKMLRGIQLAYPVIESVTIRFSNEIYTIDLPDTD